MEEASEMPAGLISYSWDWRINTLQERRGVCVCVCVCVCVS